MKTALHRFEVTIITICVIVVSLLMVTVETSASDAEQIQLVESLPRIIDATESATTLASSLSASVNITDIAATPAAPAISDSGVTCPCGNIFSSADRCERCGRADRMWIVSSRQLSNNACCANLTHPQLTIARVNECGRTYRTTFEEYQSSREEGRSLVVYVHGNRINQGEAAARGRLIYRYLARYRSSNPIDWVTWSWPSEQQGILMHDVREKARRTDAQGLYLAWFLREYSKPSQTSLIGYSFGGRVVTGSLHALAGGQLAGRRLPGSPRVDSGVRVGLVAPAIERNWLLPRGYHGEATKNLDRIVVLYNRRDRVLKRYWLLDFVRGSIALGYAGPAAFGLRYDGSRLPVIAQDFAQVVGRDHDELDYYSKDCRTGAQMARLINESSNSQ